jgi:hypothetical protein
MPFLQPLFGTAALPVNQLILVIPFAFIVWGADELRRLWRRLHAHLLSSPEVPPTPSLSVPDPTPDADPTPLPAGR